MCLFKDLQSAAAIVYRICASSSLVFKQNRNDAFYQAFHQKLVVSSCSAFKNLRFGYYIGVPPSGYFKVCVWRAFGFSDGQTRFGV